MVRKHKPEEIIGKLREAEIVLAQGGTVADACRRIGVTEQSYYRWRKEYGGLKMDQARRMKDLEKENARLRRAALLCQFGICGSASRVAGALPTMLRRWALWHRMVWLRSCGW